MKQTFCVCLTLGDGNCRRRNPGKTNSGPLKAIDSMRWKQFRPARTANAWLRRSSRRPLTVTIKLFSSSARVRYQTTGMAPQREQQSAWPGDLEKKLPGQLRLWVRTQARRTQPTMDCCGPPTTSAITPSAAKEATALKYDQRTQTAPETASNRTPATITTT